MIADQEVRVLVHDGRGFSRAAYIANDNRVLSEAGHEYSNRVCVDPEAPIITFSSQGVDLCRDWRIEASDIRHNGDRHTKHLKVANQLNRFFFAQRAAYLKVGSPNLNTVAILEIFSRSRVRRDN